MNKLLSIVFVAFAGLGIAQAATAPAASPAPHAAAAATGTATGSGTCPALLDHTFHDLQTGKPVNLCQYAGKVVIVVNTASFCGFAPQEGQLQALYHRFGPEGLVVLGFPSADFHQEFSDTQSIVPFSRKHYDVRYPLFELSHVTEPSPNPLFQQLIQASGVQPKWNFYKYVIGRDGKFAAEYPSTTAPDSAQFQARIQALLRAKP
ncbi:MAG: glutathione peroxidase [Betaproteobacteria bacterium]|nr:glutathione peroxidase [Betaproteobacteria bacterium]